ncbi:MAG: PKD domain-containing protein [Planctomycetia bacterium]|nr:MAG: PKD domain-containing protein [Planctomycetia bacterium]
MAHPFRRSLAWLPLLTLAAVFPTAWFVSSAAAEERKFVIILADLPKDEPGPRQLPNRVQVYDAYFDQVKDGQGGTLRVDSFAEWWEEVSYGNVTVSGDVYGWVQMPWRSTLPGGPGGGQGGSFRNLNGGPLDPGTGEGFNNALARFQYDLDGVGGNRLCTADNCEPADFAGAQQVNRFAPGANPPIPVWTPGERFFDINGNNVYDAGVREWGIDKNGDGQITGPSAPSFIDLFQVNNLLPAEGQSDGNPTATPPEPPVAEHPVAVNSQTGPIQWANTFEWFDSNGDGQWNADGAQSGPLTVTFDTYNPATQALGTGTFNVFRGDWGGTEVWIDLVGLGASPAAVGTGEQRWPGQRNRSFARASIWMIIVESFGPDGEGNLPDDKNVYYDEQGNGQFDFPEPFEDFLRIWSAGGSFRIFNPDPTNADGQYVINNFAGDPQAIFDRTGNGRYNAPDGWTNTGSSKMQPITAQVQDGVEAGEQNAMGAKTTPEPAWYVAWWFEEFGNLAPQWDPAITYYRSFNQAIPTPPNSGNPNPTQPMGFLATGGGPFNNGLNFGFTEFAPGAGQVKPDIAGGQGMYDGPAEFWDLPSSIYHAGGDTQFGEVTGPEGWRPWGFDVGAGPNGPTADDEIVAAGPVAFNIHGDGGWDAGNQQNIEAITWRTNGQSLTDQILDLDGDGVADFALLKRDANLDGLIDVGEAANLPGAVGLPNGERDYVPNYGMRADSGGGDGGPAQPYPFNRMRLMEDAVEATDDIARWDNFFGGQPPFGNVVSGVILCSDRTPGRMFRLPAASLNYPIRTRDRIIGPETFRSSYQPLTFFDGLGITISSFGNDQGNPIEGDALITNPSLGFQMPWSCHEYAHTWEGFPDLYDYDVYRTFDSLLLNNPISRWCVMAGGGAVHPVPVLKADPRNGHSGWIKPVDLTTALKPASVTALTFKPWEFDRDKTVFVYNHELFPAEQFWLWRTANSATKMNGQTDLTFDQYLPAHGLMIMHVDREADPEGLPQQQRTGSRFTYRIVQADGFASLENGDNNGDAGDPWPGVTNKTQWNRDSSPNNRWYNNQNSGLSIVGMREVGNTTVVDFRWTPQDVPSFEWKQPPGGISVNSQYQLQYIAYDQFGGTRLQFFVYKNEPQKPAAGTMESYDPANVIQINPAATKFPGEIDGVYSVNLANLLLLDGTYTFFAKLMPGVGADNRLENSASAPRPSINNRGNGLMTVTGVDLDVSRLEAWTVRCVNAQVTGAEQWEVTGTVTGTQVAQATTGLPYLSDGVAFAGDTHNRVSFIIQSGSVPFQVGDEFNFLTTGFTPHSSAVLVKQLQVITPQPPVPGGRIDGPNSGLAPFQVVFMHDGTIDPGGAALTFQWDFGDGSPPFITDRLDQPVLHTYNLPRAAPYQATLTVTNSFGQSATQTLLVTVREAVAPTVRVAVNPSIGPSPLTVEFTGSLTTDPNPGTTGLDFVWDFGDGTPVATTANTTHTYQRAGNYRATLTVTNRPYGKAASQTVEIRATGTSGNLPPEATIVTSTRFGQAPLRVLFDGRASFDPEGSALTYEWNFGDGSAISREPVIEYTYTKTGTFNAVLTVRDDREQVDTAVVAIVVSSSANNSSPVARISVSGTQGPAPFTVTFDGSRSADPEGGSLKYAWDFGDGKNGEGVAVTHTYEAAGRYTAVLTVEDAFGLAGATTVVITVTTASGDSGLGQPDPGDLAPELSGCGAGCGPAGFMPLLLTLIGIGGMRRLGVRRPRR